MEDFVSKLAQGYFVMSIAAVLLLLASFKATMYFGDAVSRMFF